MPRVIIHRESLQIDSKLNPNFEMLDPVLPKAMHPRTPWSLTPKRAPHPSGPKESSCDSGCISGLAGPEYQKKTVLQVPSTRAQGLRRKGFGSSESSLLGLASPNPRPLLLSRFRDLGCHSFVGYGGRVWGEG